MPKKPTKSEKLRMSIVKELPCIVCGAGPVDVHHITQCGRRLGNDYTIPLCYNCHRGDDGFSGKNREAWDKSLDNQLKLLDETNMLIREVEDSYV